MKLWQKISAGGVCCALLSTLASAASAQKNGASLESLLEEIEASYDSAMWVVYRGGVDSVLADTIRSQRAQLGRLPTGIESVTAGEEDRRIERRWNIVQRFLMMNLDSLAVRVRSRAFVREDLNPLAGSMKKASRDTATPLVSDMTARVLRELNPVLGAAAARSMSQARFAAVSQLFYAFRMYRERLLALAEEACLARNRLCLAVDPPRNRPYGGVTISGYSGDLYGIGGFVSISRFMGVQGKVIQSRRAVIGVQFLAQLPEFREGAFEISGGSVFGDFVVMPGLIVSPGRDRVMELSGSVLYLPRSRLSLGLSYALDHGLGIRAVYGFRPRSQYLAQTHPVAQ